MAWPQSITALGGPKAAVLALSLAALARVALRPLRKRAERAQRRLKGGPLRVLIVANRVGEFNGETGGGSIFRQKLMEGLAHMKHMVTCLSIGRADVDYMHSVRGPVMCPSMRNLSLTSRAVETQDLVIISGSWSLVNIAAAYFSFLHGVPCLTFVTTNSTAAVDASFSGPMWCFAYCLYLLSDYVNCYLSTAAWTRSGEYLKVLRKRGVPVRGVVSCGDQYDAFRGVDPSDEVAEARRELSGGFPEKPILLYCGRLCQEKRIPLLVRAKPEGVVLAIVGTGTEVEYFRRLHNPAKGIVCLVNAMVPQERLRLYYKAADVHVSASTFETLGNTVHESLLCGCPVVVQRAGGYVSQVCDGRNGYLVDWEDVGDAQRAIAGVLDGELTLVAPLERETTDAMDIIQTTTAAHVSTMRTVVAILIWPYMFGLWGLSKVYHLFAAEASC